MCNFASPVSYAPSVPGSYDLDYTETDIITITIVHQVHYHLTWNQ